MGWRERGFTWIEVVAALAVVGILAALAVKPANGLLRRIKMNNAVNALKHLIVNARAQAVANPMVHCGVAFRIRSGGQADSAWSFLDRSKPPNNDFDPGTDPWYQRPYALKAADSVHIESATPSAFVFRGDGSANRSAKIVIRLRNLVDTIDVLASTGRVRVVRP